MVEQIEIFEVGPRDGLQNEKRIIPTQDKIALVNCLSSAGFRRIEVASFVSPKWVPQMADSADVLAGITRAPNVRYAALTPNMKGFDAAMAAKADEIAIFGAASEGFSKANINASCAEAMARFDPVIKAAQARGIRVRGYISCVTDCPYDGPIAPAKVAQTAKAFMDLGCYEISLGETIGKGRPESVDAMLAAVLEEVPAKMLAGHFHDTDGFALQNIETSIARGLRVFDASIAGLGGCPYAPGASGNVATESVNALAMRLGFETGLDRSALEQAVKIAQRLRPTKRDINV